MTLQELTQKLGLQSAASSISLDREVTGGYASDLLSDVIANSQKSNVWVTLQTHVNIVAVASLKELAGIVIVNGRKPESKAIEKARQEDVPILLTNLEAFEIVGRLYQIGIGGNRNRGSGTAATR